jgi:tetratricopeptide (TPR) repeat protein
MSTKRDYRKQKKALLKKKKRAEKKKSSSQAKPPPDYDLMDGLMPAQAPGRDEDLLFRLLDDDELFEDAVEPTDRERMDIGELRFHSFDISYEPMEKEANRGISQDLRERLDFLHYQVQEKPAEALEELETLRREHPEIPRVYNYLTIAYQGLGNRDKAREIAAESYREHPNYLFAKMAYATHCLNDGKLDEVEAILNNQFDLLLMYPDRKVFHISEVMAFYGFMGQYFAAKKEFRKARIYYKILRDLDPEHPMTELVGFDIIKSAFAKLGELAAAGPPQLP